MLSREKRYFTRGEGQAINLISVKEFSKLMERWSDDFVSQIVAARKEKDYYGRVWCTFYWGIGFYKGNEYGRRGRERSGMPIVVIL